MDDNKDLESTHRWAPHVHGSICRLCGLQIRYEPDGRRAVRLGDLGFLRDAPMPRCPTTLAERIAELESKLRQLRYEAHSEKSRKHNDDQGDLAVIARDGAVVVELGRGLAWFALSIEKAQDFVRMLEHAIERAQEQHKKADP